MIAIASRFFSPLCEGGRLPIGPSVWGDTRVSLVGRWPEGKPAPSLRDALSGQILKTETANGEPALSLSRVFAHLPVALLEAVA